MEMPDKITKCWTLDSDDMYTILRRKKKSCDTCLNFKAHNKVHCPHQINFKARQLVYKSACQYQYTCVFHLKAHNKIYCNHLIHFKQACKLIGLHEY